MSAYDPFADLFAFIIVALGQTRLPNRMLTTLGAFKTMFEAVMIAAAMATVEPAKAEPKGNTANWVRAKDLPEIDARAAVTTFDITIDKAGKSIRCTIVRESGSELLDAAVCSALMKRSRFRPATGPDGSPVYSVYRDRVVWIPQGRGRNSSFDGADIVITSPDVQAESDDLTEVLISIDESGSVSSCSISENGNDGRLNDLACQIASDPRTSLPIIDSMDAKVSGLRSFFVVFEPGSKVGSRLR